MELNQTIIKELIYRHRLYPILTLIFQRCELATVTLNPDFNFNDDLIYLLNKNGQGGHHQQQQRRKSQCGVQQQFSPLPASTMTSGLIIEEQQLLQQSNNIINNNNNNQLTSSTTMQTASSQITTAELDEFLQDAIQVLYIHLLELEKVHELCTEFCSKYIQCLKGKLIKQRKETIGILDEIDEQEDEDNEDNDKYGQEDSLLGKSATGQEINANSAYQHHFRRHDGCPAANTYGTTITTLEPQQQTISGGINQYYDANTGNATIITNNTPVSIQSSDDDSSSTTSPPTTSKRSLFTKQATAQLRNWLFTHLSHPYPTEQEKQQLSDLTGLNILQVNNWFINARRRIVQPLIDRENRVGLMSNSNRVNNNSNSDEVEISK